MSELFSETSDTNRDERMREVLYDAYGTLMERDEGAFRYRFRKMAADPFAFYRGSAPLFYADIAGLDPPSWVDERTSRIWIHGDLHVENFATYMDAAGKLVLDVHDFDEAYVGPFTWDLYRFAVSVALLCRRKALPDEIIDRLVDTFARRYLAQVRAFVSEHDDRDFALRLDTVDEGPLQEVLLEARMSTRGELLDRESVVDGDERRFRRDAKRLTVEDADRDALGSAIDAYRDALPAHGSFTETTFTIKDVVHRRGFGIGSAGLPTYNVLIEGATEAREDDIVLAVKAGNVAAPSRVVTDTTLANRFAHPGHRTAESQRALQAHADPLLGSTRIRGVGYVVSPLSPYQNELDWDAVSEPDQLETVIVDLARAVAKTHCVSDEEADSSVVPFQTEEAIDTAVTDEEEFVADLRNVAHGYASQVRRDHELFVDLFRSGGFTEVAAHG